MQGVGVTLVVTRCNKDRHKAYPYVVMPLGVQGCVDAHGSLPHRQLKNMVYTTPNCQGNFFEFISIQ